MSASSKKKLRKELAAEMLTEKQRQEQKEAKKLKAQTVSFVAIMLVIAITAVSILGVQLVNNSGILEKNTIAAVVDGNKLNSVQMNYYLNDYIQTMYSQWQNDYGSSISVYLGMMGLNVNAPLDEQEYNPETGETWGDYFLTGALAKAKNDYALYAKATAEGFQLDEEQQKAMDSNLKTLDLYASLYGYKNADKFLQSRYGHGSTLKTYTDYTKITTIASAYYTKYSESLTYDDAAIREHEKGKENDFTSFSYATYTLYSTSFLEGGTKDESGNTVYSDAEKEAALKKAEEAINSLKTATNLEELDKAIAALDINKDKTTTVASTKRDDILYPQIPENLQSWLSDKARVENEITVIAEETTSTGEDGKEVKTTNGYSVVLFDSRNENLRPLANVRHLLVKFEGGTTGTDGNKTYSEAEKAKAKAEAESLLKQWEEGEKSEESFKELVKNHTDDDGSKETGGLYEDIHPQSNFVETFRNWAVNADRKTGDTGVIVSEYGYHVMYYVGDDELTYRDYMIREDKRAEDVEKWYTAIVDASTATLGKTSRLNTDFILATLASS